MPEQNPQHEQMAHESMVRNLAAQALAIWPQERALLARYQLGRAPRILDAGCGTGEGSSRLAEEFADARVLGVDVLEGHLELARSRYAALAPRLSFQQGDIFALPAADASYDLTVCRHVLQAIPHPERALAELRRVTRPGGVLHLLVEDYGMLFFPHTASGLDPQAFFRSITGALIATQHVDPFIGRHAVTHLAALGCSEIALEYVAVDTLRVPRDVFANILEAWRDGYSELIASVTNASAAEVAAQFAYIIALIREPSSYVAWLVPVVSARV